MKLSTLFLIQLLEKVRGKCQYDQFYELEAFKFGLDQYIFWVSMP